MPRPWQDPTFCLIDEHELPLHLKPIFLRELLLLERSYETQARRAQDRTSLFPHRRLKGLGTSLKRISRSLWALWRHLLCIVLESEFQPSFLHAPLQRRDQCRVKHLLHLFELRLGLLDASRRQVGLGQFRLKPQTRRMHHEIRLHTDLPMASGSVDVKQGQCHLEVFQRRFVLAFLHASLQPRGQPRQERVDLGWLEGGRRACRS